MLLLSWERSGYFYMVRHSGRHLLWIGRGRLGDRNLRLIFSIGWRCTCSQAALRLFFLSFLAAGFSVYNINNGIRAWISGVSAALRNIFQWTIKLTNVSIFITLFKPHHSEHFIEYRINILSLIFILNLVKSQMWASFLQLIRRNAMGFSQAAKHVNQEFNAVYHIYVSPGKPDACLLLHTSFFQMIRLPMRNLWKPPVWLSLVATLVWMTRLLSGLDKLDRRLSYLTASLLLHGRKRSFVIANHFLFIPNLDGNVSF